tara:strand:+ start:3762 stop:5204 length:1443 start_codon:yes stop_codon:yes gene_type:complete
MSAMNTRQNFIGGDWVDAPEAAENINPSDTRDVVGIYGRSDRAHAEAAIAAAQAAARSWGESGIQQRFDVLDAIGTEILARKEELGRLLSQEEGKTLPEGIGEVARAGQVFKFFAGETLRLQGEILASVRPGVSVEVTREPIGVVGIITPWNFPIAIPAWKIAPALAYGNTVVFKPAELTPGCGWALAEIISRSGIPEGVFNLVMGQGSIVGQALIEDSRVDAVSFTGSVATGRRVAKACSERGAKYQLEMGGKNPLIILADADLDNAVECAVNGAYYSTGQRCTASSRLIVEDSVHDKFVDRLTARIEGLTVDHALKAGTQIGPVVDDRQLQQNLRYIKIGLAEGARLVSGGEVLSRDTPGFYMSPTLFADTRNDMQINREEIFGPVAMTIRARDIDEAIAIANQTEFGLSAGICTQSLAAASQFKRRIQAGMAMVNLPTAGVDYHVPFGGTKASSFGSREQGRYASEFYTTVKTAYLG